MSQAQSLFNESHSIIARVKQLREMVPSLGLKEAKAIADDELKRQFPPPVGQCFKVMTTERGNIALVLSAEALDDPDTRERAINALRRHRDCYSAELRCYEDSVTEEVSLADDVKALS